MKINNKIIRLKRFIKQIVMASEARQSRRMARLKAGKPISLLLALTIILSLFLVAVPMAEIAEAATINVPGDYTTIQAAIDAASPGDTINVAAGTYDEDISINKSVSFLGPNADISAVTGTRNAEAKIVRMVSLTGGVSDVTINGFEFSNIPSGSHSVIYLQGDSTRVVIKNNRFMDNPCYAIKSGASSVTTDIQVVDNLISNIAGTIHSGLWFGGITGSSVITDNKIEYTAYAGIIIETAHGLTIDGNQISNVPKQGIQIALVSGNISITNNIITNANTSEESDKGGIRLYGDEFDGPVSITGNTISGSFNGLAVKDGKDITGKDIHVNNNNFLGNSNCGVYHGGTGNLDATNNWWGDASGPSGEGPGTGDAVSANVDYNSWYNTNALSTKTYYVGSGEDYTTIQSAIGAASAGDTINVAAGTYNENISLNKSVDLLGPNADISAVTGTRKPEAVIVNQVNIADGISNASINGFEFTGQTGSQVLYFLMDSSDFTVKCNRFINNRSTAINTYASSTHSNLLIDNNLVDGITEHPPNGTGMWLGGNITGTSLISNNKIMNTSYAGLLLHGATSVTVSDNIIQNVPVQGIQIAGASGNVYITSNIITNANTTNENDKGGIRLYGDEFIGTVSITGNTISGSFNGLAVKDGKDITGKDIHVNNNNFSGNSNCGVYHGGTGTLDATNNWWGAASGPSGGVADPVTGRIANGSGDAVSNNVKFDPFLFPNVTITKTGPGAANKGNDITYTITYKNEGTFDATNVVVTETYPTEVEYVPATPTPDAGTNNKWTIGNLTSEQEGTINVTVHIK